MLLQQRTFSTDMFKPAALRWWALKAARIQPQYGEL